MPAGIDPATGRAAVVEAAEDVRQAIRIILSTRPGERLMRPEFGCAIPVFESLDAATVGRIESNVTDALIRFEPRIEVLSVEVGSDETIHGKVIVDVEYRLRDSNRRDNVVYAFYLRRNA